MLLRPPLNRVLWKDPQEPGRLRFPRISDGLDMTAFAPRAASQGKAVREAGMREKEGAERDQENKAGTQLCQVQTL